MTKCHTQAEAEKIIAELLNSLGYSDVCPRFKSNGIRIENSHTVRSAQHRISVCRVLERTDGFSLSAGVMSAEWVGHNIAARMLGLKGAKSADIEFDGDMRWYVRLFATLLDIMGIH